MKIPYLPDGKCPVCGIDQGFLIIADSLGEYLMQLKARSSQYKKLVSPFKSIPDSITELQKEIDRLYAMRKNNENKTS